MMSGRRCCVDILSKSGCDRNEFEPTLPRTLSCIVVLFLNRCMWMLCCSVAPTMPVSLQPNVQQWHLAEPPPHPNFLSPSLCCSQSILANVQPCINYSVVSVSVSVCLSICVEDHIPKTLPLLLCLCPCYLPLCVT